MIECDLNDTHVFFGDTPSSDAPNGTNLEWTAIIWYATSPTHICVSATTPSRDVCSATPKGVLSQKKCLSGAGPCPGRRSRNGQKLRDLEWTAIIWHATSPTHICVSATTPSRDVCSATPKGVLSQKKCLSGAGPCPGRRSRNGQKLRDLEWTAIIWHATSPTHICISATTSSRVVCTVAAAQPPR